MIIYYKELDGEPSTYEPIEHKAHPIWNILQDFANTDIWIITFCISSRIVIYLNKDYILQIEWEVL